MRLIKKMQAEHVYLIQGSSAANSSFFENEEDCKSFLSLADIYLSEYLSINSFQNNRDGWVMIITTNSIKQIKDAYKLRRAKSNKCKPGFEYHETWRILSDQIRIWLATYVKSTNSKTGRTGGKVRGNYKRFVFENVEEVQKMKLVLSKQKYDQSQSLKRYRPSKKLFSLKKKRLKSSIYMSCAKLTTPEKVKELGLKCLDLASLVKDVLRKLILSTFNHHFPPDLLNYPSI